ncbi:HlyD family efflux transporter periplasmic adaptor subunit [Parasphingorhabdus flavimaris]|uniref:HlyD family efflux transporter periplasmic adaptor subunit n=1 Tax=Parasphingorhabdus flavimaris TaxID=266812 RepID=A0ABX2N2Q0_9SPHN|nr:HlyD family efflux transporter periplasmic adaptor subunit [Parasphingorhabdus flavimaris]NVD27990.1 HlyD family efflux transporter periplasmic adaptor subunit [Parasphingorhabdus flavimaris]|tara:strand:- start:1653 stop:2867 length:1215 start_codon:yes stop_codon:yes gene_type:complete
MAKKHLSRPGPRVLIGLIAAVIIIAVFFALRTPPLDVDVAEAVEAPLLVTIDDEGETRVRDIYVVAAPISGELQRVDLEAGDPVVAGQTVVARIMPAQPDFLNSRNEAEVRAQIKALEASVQSSAARIGQAEADRKLAEANFSRVDALYERGFATRTAHDAARAARDSSAARLTEARGAMNAARFELRAARARLIAPSSSKTSGSALAVRSPESGSVLRVVQESQATVAVGTPIMELGDPSDIEIVSDLLSSDAVKIKPGSAVLIDNWGGDKPLKGKVKLIEPFGFTKISALGVEEQRVNVIIDFVDRRIARERLGHGYRVIVRVVEWSGDKVLQVPISGLFRDKGQWSVFVMRGGEAHLVPVAVGRMNDERAQITKGLEAGDEVILHPSEKIEDGRSVRLRDD